VKPGNGAHATIAKVASADKINASTRVAYSPDARAPDIVEAILTGRRSVNLQLADPLKRRSLVWPEQRAWMERSVNWPFNPGVRSS
jgi:hypothetical protein